jgi:hypothetical protein
MNKHEREGFMAKLAALDAKIAHERERLTAELDAKDAEIAQLKAKLSPPRAERTPEEVERAIRKTTMHRRNGKMKLYAVRIADNKDPVGFFWEASVDDLVYAIDEVVNPCETEYVILESPAAILWHEYFKEDWLMGTPSSIGPKGSRRPIACTPATEEDIDFDIMTAAKQNCEFSGSIADLILHCSDHKQTDWTKIGRDIYHRVFGMTPESYGGLFR